MYLQKTCIEGTYCQNISTVFVVQAWLTILTVARGCRPVLLTNVLFALSGGRRLRRCDTDAIGRAEELSVLSRDCSILPLSECCVLGAACSVWSAESESASCGSGWASPRKALISGEGGSASCSDSLLSSRPSFGDEVEMGKASFSDKSAHTAWKCIEGHVRVEQLGLHADWHRSGMWWVAQVARSFLLSLTIQDAAMPARNSGFHSCAFCCCCNMHQRTLVYKQIKQLGMCYGWEQQYSTGTGIAGSAETRKVWPQAPDSRKALLTSIPC